MPKHGKRYTTAVAEFDRGAPVALAEAVTRVKQNATAKFDETVELHIRTGLDPRHADQQVRGTTNLPHGLGKTIRVAVFAEGEAARDAEEAGAAIVGDPNEVVAKLEQYRGVGIDAFILSGYPHLDECDRVGRHVLPHLDHGHLSPESPT